MLRPQLPVTRPVNAVHLRGSEICQRLQGSVLKAENAAHFLQVAAVVLLVRVWVSG